LPPYGALAGKLIFCNNVLHRCGGLAQAELGLIGTGSVLPFSGQSRRPRHRLRLDFAKSNLAQPTRERWRDGEAGDDREGGPRREDAKDHLYDTSARAGPGRFENLCFSDQTRSPTHSPINW
jgi:hypothetical protein